MVRRNREARLAHQTRLVEVDIVERPVDHLGADFLLGRLAWIGRHNVDRDDR